MEQVVTQLAATHNIDLSQKGATLNLDVPDQQQRWLIGNTDGRIGVTRCAVDDNNLLAPEIDLVFEVKPEGWEPVEVVHAETIWQDYANSAPADTQGDFNFAALADTVAQDLEQQALVIQQGEQAPRPTTEQLEPNQDASTSSPLDYRAKTEGTVYVKESTGELWKKAIALGLSPDAPTEEIRQVEAWNRQDMQKRKAVMRALHWGSNPDIREKMKQEGLDPYTKWEVILYHALNLAGPVADKMPPEELAERITLARKLLRKNDKEKQQRQVRRKTTA